MLPPRDAVIFGRASTQCLQTAQNAQPGEKCQEAPNTAGTGWVCCCMLALAGHRCFGSSRASNLFAHLSPTKTTTLWLRLSTSAEAANDGLLISIDMWLHCMPHPSTGTIRLVFQMSIHCWHARSHPVPPQKVACCGTIETPGGVQKPSSRWRVTSSTRHHNSWDSQHHARNAVLNFL